MLITQKNYDAVAIFVVTMSHWPRYSTRYVRPSVCLCLSVAYGLIIRKPKRQREKA